MATKVTNMTSPTSGKEVANQFIIYTPEGEYFQSYKSVIAFRPYNADKTMLDVDYWDYSATTLKYLKEFLQTNLSKKEIEGLIANGTYLLGKMN